ncbi:substrate-binding periplasmic protein [Dongshaea marina]|uniref:substrate-binding periplasmic protein n=1 Tax=Dongshaea marina TaxID=2047966 RepID=UPI000D3EA2D7|nr:transporter substrate-binding domain-containing protein [Dongshaea marina]
MARLYQIIFVLVSLSLISGAQAKLSQLTAAVGHFPPYIFCDDKPIRGMAVELVETAYQEVGIRVEFKCYPWGRVYNLARESAVDLTFPYLRNQDREQDFHYVAPMLAIKEVFFHLKSRSFSDLMDKEGELTVEDLKPYKIGGTIGYRYGELIDEYDGKYGLSLGKTANLNFKKLIRGRIDLFVESFIVGYYEVSLLEPPFRELITNLPLPISTEKLYLIVSHKHPRRQEISKLFIRGLTMARAKGVKQKLLEKYTLPDTP